MEHSADSFEYLLHLTKGLSTECRATRQGTGRIEHLLQRLAKLTQTSYEDLSNEPEPEVWDKYSKISIDSEKERLIRENYGLVYHIERQEYVCKRIWALIDQIEDLLESIKQFVVEQKAHRVRVESQFMEGIVNSRISAVEISSEHLRETQDVARFKLDLLVDELRDVVKNIDWSQKSASEDMQSLWSKILRLQGKYKLNLTN
ncbi:LADA_0D09428g1_1 [Lachancea dasiensis]|uniref:LADA_0D09428g1_1 n=1 Tax=Lachancea dasiensis TaxID=1072105 RepID=A0A1G4J7B0_9SACH|nr:LADA_0D09428g1_1 [Lachancea dasiensis]